MIRNRHRTYDVIVEIIEDDDTTEPGFFIAAAYKSASREAFAVRDKFHHTLYYSSR
jgi:hypothetical protein